MALAGLELAEANGEVETTTFALFCLGFFISLLLRRCFCDIGSPMAACLARNTRGREDPRRFVCACTIYLSRPSGTPVLLMLFRTAGFQPAS